MHIVELPPQANERAVAEALERLPQVEFAELDQILPPHGVVPNDPLFGSQTNLYRILASDAWTLSTGSSNLTIAFVDSGIYSPHIEFSGRLVAGWNLYDNTADTWDYTGHGTMVAGVAAAATNNAIGVAGICWSCRIMPIRVSDLSGNASVSAIASGIDWARTHGARIVNLGYAASNSSTVRTAAQSFYNSGGVVVAPMGQDPNFGSGAVDSSADNPYILTITGTNPGTLLEPVYAWSNTGPSVDLSAPGAATYTTAKTGGYTSAAGNSFAAAAVTGVAALVLARNPALTPAQVESILEQSALDLGPPGWDSSYGWGRLDAFRAASAVSSGSGGDNTAPTVSVTEPDPGDTVSGTTTITASASDNVGVTSVTFQVDGATLCTDTTSPYSCSWNTTSYTNGSHNVTAIARDAANNSASDTNAANVSNSSSDTTRPTVSITSPSNGATVSGAITVAASASDNVGVSKVEFYVDGSLKATDSTSPYSFSWDTTSAANASHTLTAQAFDAAGNNNSHSIGVTVSNSATSTPVRITSYSVSNITSTSARINWTTNVSSTGAVLYGTSSRSLNQSVSHNVLTTSHSVTVTNLDSNSWYYFQIRAVSGSSSDTSSVDRFRTPR